MKENLLCKLVFHGVLMVSWALGKLRKWFANLVESCNCYVEIVESKGVSKLLL